MCCAEWFSFDWNFFTKKMAFFVWIIRRNRIDRNFLLFVALNWNRVSRKIIIHFVEEKSFNSWAHTLHTLTHEMFSISCNQFKHFCRWNRGITHHRCGQSFNFFFHSTRVQFRLIDFEMEKLNEKNVNIHVCFIICKDEKKKRMWECERENVEKANFLHEYVLNWMYAVNMIRCCFIFFFVLGTGILLEKNLLYACVCR